MQSTLYEKTVRTGIRRYFEDNADGVTSRRGDGLRAPYAEGTRTSSFRTGHQRRGNRPTGGVGEDRAAGGGLRRHSRSPPELR